MNTRTAYPQETPTRDLADRLTTEFELARTELVEACRAQQRKDTPEARKRVATCRTTVDGVLDMWNDLVVHGR